MPPSSLQLWCGYTAVASLRDIILPLLTPATLFAGLGVLFKFADGQVKAIDTQIKAQKEVTDAQVKAVGAQINAQKESTNAQIAAVKDVAAAYSAVLQKLSAK